MLAGRRRRRPDPHASHGRPEPCGGWGSGGREPAKDLRTTSDQREGGPCKFSGPFFYSHTPVISSPFTTLQPHPRVGGHFRRAARCRRDGPAGLHRPACRPACQPRADPCKHASTSPNIPGRGRAGEGRQGRKGKFFPPHPPSLRAGGVGEGRPRPPEAAVRTRQGGQTWVASCKNRAAAATAHGFTQQQQLSSLPMWLAKSRTAPPVGP